MIACIADMVHYNEVLSRVARADHFDSVWTGAHCKACRRKDFCQDRIK